MSEYHFCPRCHKAITDEVIYDECDCDAIIEKNENLTCLFTEKDWDVWEIINKKDEAYQTSYVKCPKCERIMNPGGLYSHFYNKHVEYEDRKNIKSNISKMIKDLTRFRKEEIIIHE